MHQPALNAEGQLAMDRDAHGVPHIRADNEADLYRGLGYCHGFDRGLQVLLVRILAAGRGSELLDSSDAMLDVDRTFRRMNFASDAAERVGAMSAADRGLAEAYCDGMNAALVQRPPWELRLRRYRPEAWTVEDTVVLSRVVGYVGLAQSQAEMERLFVELVQGGVAREHLEELFPGLLGDVDLELLRRVQLGERVVPEGLRWNTIVPRMLASNNWAIAGRKTASGLPLLANDPHLEGNRLPAIWYEVVLELGNRYCIASTMPGLPGPLLGRTNDLAWGATYTFLDAVDSWIEDCRNGSYRRCGEDGTEDAWLPFRTRTEVIQRRRKADVSITFYENEHGCLDGDPNHPGLYLATRWSGASGPGVSSSVMAGMIHAESVEEGMDLVGAIDFSFNWVLADRHDNIGYQMSGRMPLRRAGWSGFVPAPGWDPANDWQGFADPGDLPRALNPTGGFLATANNDLNHLGIVRPINLPMGPYRAERIEAALAARDDWSVQTVRALQMDVYSTQAALFLEVLRPHLPRTPQGEILRGWDCRYTPDSQGAYLFELLYRDLFIEVFGSVWGDSVARHVLDETGILVDFHLCFDRILLAEKSAWFGDESRDEIFTRVAARALAAPARAWRTTQQLTLQHLVLGGGRLARWLGLDAGPITIRGGRATVHQGQIYRSAGRQTSFVPSYRLVTDFGEQAAHTALLGGPSDRPFSPWYKSGVEDWVSGRLKTLRPRSSGGQ